MRHFFKNLLHFFLKSSFFRGYSSEPGLMQLQKRGGLLSSYIRIFNFLFWKKLKSSVIGFITNSQFFSLSPMRSGRQRGWAGYSAGLSPETPSSSPALTASWICSGFVFKNLLHFFLKSSFFRGYSSEPGLMQLQKRGGLLSSYIRIFNFLFWKKLKSSVIGFITNSQFFSLSPMRSGRQRGWAGYSAGLSPETPSSSPALTASWICSQ